MAPGSGLLNASNRRCARAWGRGWAGRAGRYIIEVSRSDQGARCEGSDSPQVFRRRGALRVRRDVEDAIDQPELHLEICSSCHPFFTGKQKLLDTEGRVERFTKKFGAQTSEARKIAAKKKPAVKPTTRALSKEPPVSVGEPVKPRAS